MAEDFIRRGDKALEAKLAAARDGDEIRDILLADQLQRGMPTKYDRVGLPGSAGTGSSEPIVETPKSGDQLFRRAVTIGNVTRLLEAYSVGGLDALENSLRTGRIW